MYTADICGEL